MSLFTSTFTTSPYCPNSAPTSSSLTLRARSPRNSTQWSSVAADETEDENELAEEDTDDRGEGEDGEEEWEEREVGERAPRRVEEFSVCECEEWEWE